jgi:hypothetical protein
VTRREILRVTRLNACTISSANKAFKLTLCTHEKSGVVIGERRKHMVVREEFCAQQAQVLVVLAGQSL